MATDQPSGSPTPTNAGPYSRTSTVTALRTFYGFLATLPRLPASAVLDAPASGWPALTDSFLARLGPKTDAVRDLLRHVPVIAATEGGEGNALIGPSTTALRWDDGDGLLRWALGRGAVDGVLSPHGAGGVPPHVAVLARGGRYGSWLLVDVEAGTMTDFVIMGTPERRGEGGAEVQADSPGYWRAFRTRPVADFFEEWVNKYRSLEWAVVPGSVEDGVLFYRDTATEVCVLILRFEDFPVSAQLRERYLM